MLKLGQSRVFRPSAAEAAPVVTSSSGRSLVGVDGGLQGGTRDHIPEHPQPAICRLPGARRLTITPRILRTGGRSSGQAAYPSNTLAISARADGGPSPRGGLQVDSSTAETITDAWGGGSGRSDSRVLTNRSWSIPCAAQGRNPVTSVPAHVASTGSGWRMHGLQVVTWI